MNSVQRYIRGNFLDGVKQDGIDLFLGNYTVNPTHSPILKDKSIQNVFVWIYSNRFDKLQILTLLAFSTFMFLTTLLIRTSKPRFTSISHKTIIDFHMFRLLNQWFWFAVVVVILLSIRRKGTDFVNLPHLCPPLDRKFMQK